MHVLSCMTKGTRKAGRIMRAVKRGSAVHLQLPQPCSKDAVQVINNAMLNSSPGMLHT